VSEWASAFTWGLCVGIPLWGSLGAMAIVLVASAKRADERLEREE
jgi:hypothetical protein